MKRTILVALAIYSALFALCGAYIIFSIHGATARLDHLIMLHQVEILREHYMLQIKHVQTDLALRNTAHSRDFDEVVADVVNMGRVIHTCYDCHHRPEVLARIDGLRDETEAYKQALSRVLTYRGNAARLAAEEETAFHLGEALTGNVGNMIAMTAARLESNTQRTMEQVRRMSRFLYVLLAAGPLASLALAAVFVRGLTKPMGVLLEGTRRLQRGELGYRVRGLKHEFGELGQAFNEMAASIQRQLERMQRTEQMVLVGELAAGLAHEIKNPLAGMKVAVEVLSAEAGVPDEDRDVLRQMKVEVERLESLMKSFLSFARPPKPHPQEVDVNGVVRNALAFYVRTPRVGQVVPRIEVVQELRPLPPTLADPSQLQQVLLNLLLNAAEAMSSGGTLTVRTLVDQDAIRIDVADTGRGFDPQQAEKMFQPFFTTKPRGTGLGLAICRQLIEQQSGTIAAAPNPGGGALFTVRLPLRAVPAGAGA
ncbi:MAG: HAMP domain-containing histidine kinase [Acidobacteria bacterium]|nr:HAMP domain-containing histidine kinase [Acidobacteriota bacterium]